MGILRKIQYNSPLILTYALISLIVLGVGSLTAGESTRLLFSVYHAPLSDPLTYFRFFGHAFGHADITHYASNFILILLIGPILEEKYGWLSLLIMMLTTMLITGLLSFMLFPGVMLLGASGVAFMLIILSSFVNLQKGKIPVTLLLIVIIYIGQEIVLSVTKIDNISQITHIAGGICGAVMGYLINRSKFGKTVEDVKKEADTYEEV